MSDLTYSSPNDTVFTVRNVQVKFGEGVSSEAGYEAKRLGMTKVLIVTDRNIVENTGIPTYVRDSLEEEGIEADVFDGVHIEPIDAKVVNGIEFAEGGGTMASSVWAGAPR